jgi:hypothetical protein
MYHLALSLDLRWSVYPVQSQVRDDYIVCLLLVPQVPRHGTVALCNYYVLISPSIRFSTGLLFQVSIESSSDIIALLK